jgi:Holliday junction resolvase
MARGAKAKGSKAERDLLNEFWGNGWAAMRAAGSGSTQFPCPDLLVGKNGRRLAVEVKFTSDTRKYFPHDEIKQLKYFAHMFGAESWLAIKFPKVGWYFFTPEDLEEKGKSYVATVDLAELKGLRFEELE